MSWKILMMISVKFLYLSEDGNQAIVVGPTMNTVKILYKTDIAKSQLDHLINHIGSLGFKTKKLVRVEQG